VASATDVVFVSYEEPKAEEHFARLLTFAPRRRRPAFLPAQIEHNFEIAGLKFSTGNRHVS
jgi:hypothetical protein